MEASDSGKAYSAGEGPAAFIISSEIFPLTNREVGMSFAVRDCPWKDLRSCTHTLQVFWNLLGAGILALIAPALAHALTHAGLLGLFSGFNLIAWVAVFFLVPETARVELEEINSICKFPPTLPTSKYSMCMLSNTQTRFPPCYT
jgi:Sugar (and other) transporter